MAEPYDLLGRVLVGVVLLVLLVGSFLLAGAAATEPVETDYPDQMDVRQDRTAYVGEQVVVGGFVVETDPVVVATTASGDGRFTLVGAEEHLTNADEPLEEGDDVDAFGTLEDESTLVVERSMTENPSDGRYLYGVSAVAALWLVGRVVTQWRFDPSTVAFVPRGRQSGDARSDDGRDRGLGAGGGDRRG